MINKDIRNLKKNDLLNWLRNEAGVSHPTLFGPNLFVGGLELQQVPKEYAELLYLLKENNTRTYLNIGIGKGGSFITESYIQEDLDLCVAVDNSSYWHSHQKDKIIENINWLENNIKAKVEFYDADSTLFLKSCKQKFDVIFIDGDHSYDGVYSDYINSLPLLDDNGLIIFHDINSHECPGVVKLWNEIKNKNCIEFIYSVQCGIGVFKAIK